MLAIRQWRSRPRDGEEPHMPRWMATIDEFTAGRAFGLSALLAGVNPKNLALTLALAIFVILASLTVAVPVLYSLFAGHSAEKTLASWKA